MQITTIGLDIAKNVFRVHGIDAAEKVVVRKQLRRGQMLAFFKALPPCLVGMEACAKTVAELTCRQEKPGYAFVTACSRRGRISGRPWHPKLTDSTAPMAPECQSFLDNVVARDQRHLIAELPRRITRERPVR